MTEHRLSDDEYRVLRGVSKPNEYPSMRIYKRRWTRAMESAARRLSRLGYILEVDCEVVASTAGLAAMSRHRRGGQ